MQITRVLLVGPSRSETVAALTRTSRCGFNYMLVAHFFINLLETARTDPSVVAASAGIAGESYDHASFVGD